MHIQFGFLVGLLALCFAFPARRCTCAEAYPPPIRSSAGQKDSTYLGEENKSVTIWLGIRVGGHSTTILSDYRKSSTGLLGVVALTLGRPERVNVFFSFVYWEARPSVHQSEYYVQPSTEEKVKSIDIGLRFPLAEIFRHVSLSLAPAIGIGGTNLSSGAVGSFAIEASVDWEVIQDNLRLSLLTGFRGGGKVIESGSSFSFVTASLGLLFNLPEGKH